VAEVATLCRCTPNTVRYWIHLGKLTTIKPGKKRLIEEPSLRKLMADNRRGVPVAHPERSKKPPLPLDDLPPEFGCDFDSPAQRRRR
jgi:excisionase family DNA binding protein